MDEVNPLPAAESAAAQASSPIQEAGQDWPTVLVKYPRLMAGRVVNNRTGETVKVLIIPLTQKYKNVVDIRMIDPDMVEL